MASARKNLFFWQSIERVSFRPNFCITRIDQAMAYKEFPHEDALTGKLGGPFVVAVVIFRGLAWRSCPDTTATLSGVVRDPSGAWFSHSKNHA